MAARRKGPGLAGYCREREPAEKERREACRNTFDPVTGIPGVTKPNRADPCLHGGPCITGVEAYNYCLDHKDQYGCSFVLAFTPPEIEGGTWTPPSDDVNDVDETENTDDNTETVSTDNNSPTSITIDGCPEGQVKYDINLPSSGMLGNLGSISLPCTPISTFCQSFPDLCNDLGQIIDVTDGVIDDDDDDKDDDDDDPIACNPPCGPNQICNETLGRCEDKITIDEPTGSCYDPNRITDEDGNCTTECKAGYIVGEDQSGEFICISEGNGGSSNEDCSNPEYAAANPEECQNIDLDCAAQNRVTITTGGIGIGSGTTRCGGCSNGYTEDALGNCVQDNNNTNNVDDPDDDPCADVDCTDEANATNDCCNNNVGSTPFDCASVGKAPLWAGSLPTSEAGCGPCLPTHNTNEDGSCSPKVNGGDNGTDPGIDPGLGIGVGAGTGSITQGMFQKYIPEFRTVKSELLGRAPTYNSGMNMEGLFKGFV